MSTSYTNLVSYLYDTALSSQRGLKVVSKVELRRGNVLSSTRCVGPDGFKAVGRHPFEIWTSGIKQEDVAATITASSTRAMDQTTIIEKAKRNVQELSSPERQALIGIWTQEIQEDAAAEFFEVVEDAVQSQHDLSNVHERSIDVSCKIRT
ncbi:hypothetical protein LTR10_012887 [Elasticomyces elasticus]|nr:hypothetical protein LTR10_012887 [Elasticomyces elasticus]KAK4978690.1 hypothetical protein LTR42_001190 [Elasticomyces elasticus]